MAEYSVLTFDELNRLGKKPRSMPIDKYFDEMDLSDEQKKERKSLAEDIEDIMLDFMVAAALALNNNSVMEVLLAAYLVKDLTSTYVKYEIPESFAVSYAARIATEIVRATFANINGRRVDAVRERTAEGTSDSESISNKYYLSEDRARLIGEEEANTAFNDKDYEDAVAAGFTHKRWRSMRDKRVRPTHQEADGQVVAIDEMFQVGEAQMMFPRDVINAEEYPEEICGCRCVVEYI